jgi:hypothetical protein
VEKARLTLGVSFVVVVAASMQNPLVGGCGTAHYFLVHALTATVRHELGLTRGVGRQAVFIALNTAIFAVPAVLLYLNRARLGRWYLPVGVLCTATFLLSYFLLFPTIDCP